MNHNSVRKPCILMFAFLVLLPMVFPGFSAAQTRQAESVSRLQAGINLYGRGLWRESVIELRRYQTEAATSAQRAEALYWIALAEMGAGEYEAAIQDMNELERLSPADPRYVEISYHRGRACYYLGRYDEALIILKSYTDNLTFQTSEDEARMPAGLYWMGECLYSLGQLDVAQEIFLSIMNEFPYSVKYEAASYRVALISQKKIEAELLSILKWTHEESLKTVEEYQRRERSYDQAIIAYQKRIADMLKESRLADLETANTDYQRRLVEAEARIVFLETRLRDSNIGVPGSNATDMVGSSPAGGGSSRILSIRNSAQDVVNELLSAEAGSSRASNGGDGR